MSKQFTYTGDQQALEAKLNSFLTQDSDNEFSIIGYAGTGKTTVTIDILWSYAVKHQCALVAPTNKATKVQRDTAQTSGLAEEAGENLRICTLHSLLGIRPNAFSEVKLFTHNGDLNDLSEFSLIVIDEASMLSDELLSVIRMYQDRYPRVKWVYMGDPMQLRPVKQEYRSRCFDLPKHKVVMTEVVRQVAGSPTAKLSSQVRTWAENGEWPKLVDILPTDADQIGEVRILTPRDWRNMLLEKVVDQRYLERGNFCRAIAWRNATVQGINEMVRAKIYPGVTSPFALDERVLTAAPIKEKGKDAMFVAYTDDEFTVQDVVVRTDPYYDIEVHDLTLEDSEGFLLHAFVPTVMGRRKLDQLLEDTAAKAKRGQRHLWGTFWSMKEYFDDIRPCHALTSHRAQGSTYDYAFVNANDILQNPNKQEAMESLYVATTRARFGCYIRVE